MRVFESPPLYAPCLPPPRLLLLLPLKYIGENLIFKWCSSRCIGQREFLDVCTRIKRMIVRSTFARVVEMIWKLAVGSTLWNIGLHRSFFRPVLNILFLSFFFVVFFIVLLMLKKMIIFFFLITNWIQEWNRKNSNYFRSDLFIIVYQSMQLILISLCDRSLAVEVLKNAIIL